MGNKYHARKTEVNGYIFDSAAEARRYQELSLLEKTGEIHDLTLQPKYPIMINGECIAKYYADFSYFVGEEKVIEDVKGVKTPVYRLKKKLVEALYGISITETK